MPAIKGVDFLKDYENAQMVLIDKELTIRVIAKEDSLTAEKVSGRFNDLDDIEQLGF